MASSVKILSDAAGSLVLIAASSVLIGRAAGGNNDNWVWLALGVFAVAIMSTSVITFLTVRTKETAAGVARGATEVARVSVRGLHPQLTRFVLSRLLTMTAIAAFPTFGLFFLEDAVGLNNSVESLGRMVLVVGGSLVISTYLAGWVSERIGANQCCWPARWRRRPAAFGSCRPNDSTDVLVIASVLGASIGALLSANWALANDLSTQGREGFHMGIVNLSTTGVRVVETHGTRNRPAQPDI